jgi:cell division protein FtsN
MYRVRLGPYNSFDELQRAKQKVEAQGIEASTVRVPRDGN